LLKRQAELQKILQSAVVDDSKDHYERDSQELSSVSDSVKEVENQVREFETEFDKKQEKLRDLQAKLEGYRVCRSSFPASLFPLF
jgi:hypothetical protein